MPSRFISLCCSLLLLVLAVLVAPNGARASEGEAAVHRHYIYTPSAPKFQTAEQAALKTEGCMSCHTAVDEPSMHAMEGLFIGCTDCHGGNANVARAANEMPGTPAYVTARDAAHVLPQFPLTWNYPHSANPKRSYTLLNKESPEYIRFVNPSDYRVAREACGGCHMPVIHAAERSLMATAVMFFGGASYNNGILPYKRYIIGEAYTNKGEPAALKSPVPVTDEMAKRGILPEVVPLPNWEVIPPTDVFRVFERGGRNIITQFPEIGLPNSLGQIQRLEEPGRPDIRQSNRGRGTGIRVAIPVLNIHKTRLNDPFTWYLGTNDQPGDYRTSGCGSCHVVYANDREWRHSLTYKDYGNDGKSYSVDPTIPKNESGHPIKHAFTRAIPTSQCMICHMHQPNMFINTYLGFTMWDYESDAPLMWPEKQQYPDAEKIREVNNRNPEGAAPRGKWADVDFLKNVWTDVNPKAEDTQFADYHGHGWNFRAIYKRDRKGNLLDAQGTIVSNEDPEKFHKAQQLYSIHAQVGMQCVDCHFDQDGHGNGYIYQEVAAAVQIGCKDCHGTAQAYPTLRTTGPAARPGGQDIGLIRNPDGQRRFEWLPDGNGGKKLIQRSVLDPKLEWEISLVKDSVDPDNPHFNAKAARAKLMSRDTVNFTWGPGVDKGQLAHSDDDVACFACHISWTTSCGGCHLPIEANWKTERHKYEGGETRNFATYNPQVARDDIFMLGKHSSVKNNIVAPVRSSSALILSSTNINRERIYVQQPPIAASGYSSQAFAPHFPHTVRTTETKQCDDCHLSANNDNNAIMAQTLMLGTKYIDFVGFHAYVAGAGGVEAVRVTEWDEPQAVIGSYLHRYAYPDWWQQHQERGRELIGDSNHVATQSGGNAQCIQLRGEYLFVAEGRSGMKVYDVASIANKGVSDRILLAPFSPLGQDTTISSQDATCVVLPTTQPIHPPRNEGELMRVTNQEQPFHPIYNYALITDAKEGIILTDVNTLADQEPRNNFLNRALTYNPDGLLTGARHAAFAGYYVYVAADAGVVVLNMNDPLKPTVAAVVPMTGAHAVQVQFRYLFVTDAEGLKVVDITVPEKATLVAGAAVPLDQPGKFTVARTYAYVANGRKGVAIIDVTNPEKPVLHEMFNADGQIIDARDVMIGHTNASLFAYVADGVGGLKVLQLTAPDTQPNFYGFAPEPKPELISWLPTEWPAQALSRPLERDRGGDETGGQIAIFGRLGSRPFNMAEQRQLYLNADGSPWFVTNQPQMQNLLRKQDQPAPAKP
jgi:hypothetical protein